MVAVTFPAPQLTLGGELSDLAAWYVVAAYMTVRAGWLTLPGPWPVKLALGIVIVAILGGCLMIPGPLDELAVMGLLGLFKRVLDRRRNRLAA